jgi:amino acid adenylation domain-containing protein
MSHAITDGISTAILLDDWSKAYDQRLDSKDFLETTRDFARHLNANSEVDKLSYWKHKLTNLDPCIFPRISQDPTPGDLAISAVLRIDREKFRQVLDYCESQAVTPASLFSSVWALTLAAYTCNDQVCFGYTASGRDLRVPDIDCSVGAYANLLICRADTSFYALTERQRFVQSIHAQVMRDLEYQHCALADIEHELGLSDSQALFNTIVSFQNDDAVTRADVNAQDLVFHDIAYKDPTEVSNNADARDFHVVANYCLAQYDISLGIVYGKAQVELSLDSHSSCLSTTQAERTLSLLKSILMSLVDINIDADTALLSPIDTISSQDLEEIWTWNHAAPDPVNALVHDLISKTVYMLPSNPAVCAWDGDWTYHELGSLSSQLAHRLISMGVGPEKIVGLCFEKCRWTPIAVLAVMKAGGVSLILDLELTEDRLRVILEQAKLTVMLSSTAGKDTAVALANDVDCPMLAVDKLNLAHSGVPILADFRAAVSDLKPSNTLYIVLTSGSTGVPKAVSITHFNFSSSIHYLRREHTIQSGSRVYDFAAYSFDMSWSTMLWTLECGACLCIPSPAERRDNLAESINQFDITHLLLTPTVARMLPLATLRGIQCLVLGGEALTPELSKVFTSTVKTMNHYGPCECTPVTVATRIKPETSQFSIGRGVGVVTWVADTTRNSLVPLGCVGELLLEGPLVGPGYLNLDLTAASFVHDPPWMLRGFKSYAGRRGGLYKTGDLVRYNHGGTLSYVGRKDNQIKINGQRTELGSIEHCIRSCIQHKATVHVVVELVKPRDSTKKILVAFLSTEGGSSAALRQLTACLSAKLHCQLPAFMVPSAFMWTESFPVMVSGKIDRGKLRDMCEHLSRQEINAQGVSRGTENAVPMTDMERKLAALWSTVLEVPSDTIGAGDSFIRLGGDSVGAMKLSAMARDDSFKLPVTDILRYPNLADQSKRVKPIHNTREIVVPPFSLLPSNVSSTAAREQIAALCGIATTMIEDAFPCTPLQEGLLALTLQRPGSYIAQLAYELRPDIDLDRFRQAWNDTITATPILRTRIVDLPGSGMIQVIIAAQSAVWTQTSDKMSKMDEADILAVGLGTPLMSSEIRTSLEGHSVFTWTVHHALYDGWSIPRLMRMLETAYVGVSRLESPPPFQNFVKFMQDTNKDAVSNFWTSQFEHLEAQIFPSISSSAQPSPDSGIAYQIRDLSWPRTDTTAATMVRAALAILIATYTDSSEAIFGVTVNGRHVPVHGIENMIAPTIATVPLRVKTSRDSSISQLLHQLQAQMLDMTSFEHTGLQEIRKISPAARHACDFQTLLLVHSAQTVNEELHTLFIYAEDEIDNNTGNVDELVTDFDTYAITIKCDLEATGALLRVKFDSHVISRDEVGTFAAQFESILRQLCSSRASELTIADLRTAGQRDLDQIWKWNASTPATIDRTVHGIIAQNVAQYPHSPAICAWDGHWTYQELDSIATRIALGLVSDGFGRSSAVIPICFEKSRWTPVAMLAVMKVGCASVILDTTLPHSRLEAIVREVDPPVIVSSLANLELARGLINRRVLVLCEETVKSFDSPSTQVLPTVDASANLYLVFTSGSTGTPKAAEITHSNFSSAIYHQQAATGFNRSSRVCDLAKYAFDISWSNFVHTLAAGGCICIPSQQEISNDPAGAILAYEANFIDITPSVAGVLQPFDLAGIETVVFAGEPLPNHIASRWATYARVLNMYGPAECTVKATIAVLERDSAASSASSIGRGLGLCTWVVDSQDYKRLVTVGAVGELLLEGPLVGAGYFRDTERTKKSFIDSPEWLTCGNGISHKGRQGRLYKTGDLVSYNSDGSLNFVGRKDTQTKINGQRLELSDVEHNLIACIDADPLPKFAAEVLTPRDSGKPMLVAFVQSSQDADVRAKMIGLQDRLAARLPAYMIPSAYIKIEELPLSSTGKMDRKQLRAIGASMTRHELTTSFSIQAERRTPLTDHELCLQKLWNKVLNVGIESISANDSFLTHGGDSIQAMKLVMRARHEGFDLSVADIFRNLKLSQMALRMQRRAEEPRVIELNYQPFSLLPPASQHAIEQQLTEYGLSLNNVLDILPVTDQQTRYLLGTYTTARSSVFYHTMDLSDEFDLPRIQHALVSLLERFDMLRTVVIPYKNMFLQIVLRHINSDSTVFETAADTLDEYTLHLKHRDLLSCLHFGDVVTKIFIVRQTRDKRHRIVIRLSHVQYDGISLEKMWKVFEDSYNSSVCVNNAIPSFAHHLYSLSRLDRDKMSEYWSKLLKGSSRTELKHQTTFRLEYAAGLEVVKRLPTAIVKSEDFTFANVLKATWAYVLARHSGTNDVVFGSLVHGRSQAGSQAVFGACVNTIPYRIVFGQNWTGKDLLTAVAAQQLASTPFESMGSQSIIRSCTDWDKWSFFSSVVIHQNFGQRSARGRAVDFDSADLSTGDIDDVQVYVVSTPCEDGVEILLSFKDQVVSQALAETMASDLSETMTGLYTKMDAKLIAPREIYGMSASLPLPEEKGSSVSPTSEQLTALANC